MSQKKILPPETTSTIRGSSWLLISPDELSCLSAMGALLISTKQNPEIEVNQLLTAAQSGDTMTALVEGAELPEIAAKSDTARALGMAHCYWPEQEQGWSSSLAAQELLQAIIKHCAADTLFIPFVSENDSRQAQQITIIWQLIEKIDFQGAVYAYETSLSHSINTLVDVSDTIAEKQKLLHKMCPEQHKLADVVLAGNAARTISLSADEQVDYVEGFFHFEPGANKQLFNSVNRLLAHYPLNAAPYQPLISIITRSKDRPRLLQEAVASVLAQNYPNIELLVINDGGIDVREQLQQAEERLYRLNYQNLEKNVGRAAAANIGLEQAKGDYILFLDDDDLIDVDHLRALNQAIQNNSTIDVAYCGIRVGENTIFNSSFNKEYLQVFNYIPIHAVLFSRKFIDMGIRFDESLEAFEDWDFWIQLSQQSDFYHLDKVSGDYRPLGNSDGGLCTTDHNALQNRYKVLTKWLPHYSAQQWDSLLTALREYPSAKEGELQIMAGGLYDDLEQKRKHIINLDQQISNLGQQKHGLEQQNLSFEQQQQHLGDQIKQLEQENKNIAAQLSSTEERLDDVLQSSMWRMTAPLRKTLAYLYALKARAKVVANKSQAAAQAIAQGKNIPFQFSQVAAQADSHHPLLQQLLTQAEGKSEHYVGISAYPAKAPDNLKYIAFYLPQYHPIAENDEWWGKGFTEWSNVAKAVPQFAGHYQPHLPDELGFYDLRLYDVLQRQAELAKHYGIYGFCFHHYWFGGKRLLERPFQHVMEHPELDIRFCLCWANENWTRRWDGLEQDVLIAQQHSAEDDKAFIAELDPVLKDPRYIRVNGKPLLILYRPSLLPDARATLALWRDYCRENGIGEIYLVMAQVFGELDSKAYGFDAAVEFPPHGSVEKIQEITSQVTLYNQQYSGHVFNYEQLVEKSEENIRSDNPLFRGIFPGWDNDARKPGRGNSFIHSSPLLYQNWLEKVSDYALENPVDNESMVFINAWNEWGEGAHLEPDKKYGYAYLEATAKTLQKYHPDSVNALRASTAQISKNHDTAIVLHLYYPELWEEINSYLHNLGGGFDLYISVPQGMYQEYLATILISYPQAHIFAFANRGRDIAPFLQIMHRIWPLNYHYLCKLHSKKSLYFADGAQWRNDLLTKLLAPLAKEKGKQEDMLASIQAKFDTEPKLGLLAPGGYYLPLQAHIGSNQQIMSQLLSQLGQELVLDGHFIAGSMFWCRPEALRTLDSLQLTLEDFPIEKGQRDGTPAHALERLFSQIAEQNGYSVTELF